MKGGRVARGRAHPLRTGLLSCSLALATACGGSPQGDPVQLTVPRGASLHRVADTLSARGIIDARMTRVFRAYARFRRDDRNIRAGHYAFRRGESWEKILNHLTLGRVVTVRMTIPEGFSLRQMAPRLAQISEAREDSVLVGLTDDGLAQALHVPGPGLEGYLFPDTYLFEPGTPLSRILSTMVQRYRAYWTPERRARLAELGRTEREVVTLASIVQSEARRLSEMPLISSVYHNRLAQGQPLQADPTVLYALGGPRERLLYAAIDSVADHPYNTYRRTGLPPGPISAPGEQALNAALYPAETSYYYFVARPDGSHVFTASLGAHNQAKTQARREWDTARAAIGLRGPEVDTTSAILGVPESP